jgi:hypothetical protein
MGFSDFLKGFRNKKTTEAVPRKGIRIWWVLRLLIFTVVIFLIGLYTVFSVFFVQSLLKKPYSLDRRGNPGSLRPEI